jgi:hypothetical protein
MLTSPGAARAPSYNESNFLKVPGFLRCRSPIVVAAVGESDRGGGEFLKVYVVQRGELNSDVVTADLLDVSPPKRPPTAVPTEQMVSAFPAKLIVAQVVLSGQQSKRGRFDDRIPVPRFGADGAVAFIRTCTQVDIRLETDGAAMATSCVSPRHCEFPDM